MFAKGSPPNKPKYLNFDASGSLPHYFKQGESKH